jgi:hypothetical protein
MLYRPYEQPPELDNCELRSGTEEDHMRRFKTRDPSADSGYPLDGHLDQMTADGCPLVPDAARWADADWRANLGKSAAFDASPEERLTPLPAVPRPSVRIRPWPPRTPEGFARYPQPVIRAGRFRTLGEVFTLVLVCAVIGYVCSGWALSGWLALGVSLLMLVGWMVELVCKRGMDKLFRDLLTDRWDHDLSSAPITRPRPRTRPTDA